jgi:hypothetical protein
MHKAGLLTADQVASPPTTFSFQRAARTDKGEAFLFLRRIMPQKNNMQLAEFFVETCANVFLIIAQACRPFVKW